MNAGSPARRGADYERIHRWLLDLGLAEAFPSTPLLELGKTHDRLDMARIAEDPAIREIFTAGREAMMFIASRMDAYRFFTEGQGRGFQVGIIYSPEEVLADPHFVARGWPTPVAHPELGRTVTYPGAPYRFLASPWALRRAPLLGEHNEEVAAALGRDA